MNFNNNNYDDDTIRPGLFNFKSNKFKKIKFLIINV